MNKKLDLYSRAFVNYNSCACIAGPALLHIVTIICLASRAKHRILLYKLIKGVLIYDF